MRVETVRNAIVASLCVGAVAAVWLTPSRALSPTTDRPIPPPATTSVSAASTTPTARAPLPGDQPAERRWDSPPSGVGALRLTAHSRSGWTVEWDEATDAEGPVRYLVMVDGTVVARGRERTVSGRWPEDGANVLVHVVAIDSVGHEGRWSAAEIEAPSTRIRMTTPPDPTPTVRESLSAAPTPQPTVPASPSESPTRDASPSPTPSAVPSPTASPTPTPPLKTPSASAGSPSPTVLRSHCPVPSPSTSPSAPGPDDPC